MVTLLGGRVIVFCFKWSQTTQLRSAENIIEIRPYVEEIVGIVDLKPILVVLMFLQKRGVFYDCMTQIHFAQPTT